MTAPATAPVVAAGLVGGFVAARYSGYPPLGAVVFTAAGAWCGRSWWRTSGPAASGALLGTYVAAFGLAHPLAKKVGRWGSMSIVTATAAGVVHVVADRS